MWMDTSSCLRMQYWRRFPFLTFLPTASALATSEFADFKTLVSESIWKSCETCSQVFCLSPLIRPRQSRITATRILKVQRISLSYYQIERIQTELLSRPSWTYQRPLGMDAKGSGGCRQNVFIAPRPVDDLDGAVDSSQPKYIILAFFQLSPEWRFLTFAVLELGTFSGFSALAWYEATKDIHTEIVSLELYKEIIDMAQGVFEKNKLENRIKLIEGPASERWEPMTLSIVR